MHADNDPRDAPHWRLYDKLRQDHPDLLESLEEEIQDYVADLDEFNSSEAGKEILSRWPDRAKWKKLTGKLSSGVFGAVLYEALKDEWSIREEIVKGKPVKVYERKQPKWSCADRFSEARALEEDHQEEE
jgi:hypothetical protein